MNENQKFAKEPIFGAFFHGGLWYTCPCCKGAFEVYDTRLIAVLKRQNKRKYTFMKNVETL